MSDARRIDVLTSGRQAWGILRSTCLALAERDDVRLRILAGGMHLAAGYGRTIDLVAADGFRPIPLDWMAGGDDAADPAGVVAATGRALELVGRALADDPPDALVLVGDRSETAAAALAATVTRTPIAHLHGGEETLGAYDDQLRHAISKLAHLHLVANATYAARLRALGEAPDTIHVDGAPGLDNLQRPDLPDRVELEAHLGHALRPPVVVVTVHPATLDPEPSAVVEPVTAAMRRVPATYVVTLPNADPGNERVRDALRATAADVGGATAEALGERRYWGLLRMADAMLGNSSSGLIEAPAARLPVVDVGERQAGRVRPANVIHVRADADAVVAGLERALDPAFRPGLPSGTVADGRAGRRIADILIAWRPEHPPRKAPIEVQT